MSLDGSFSLQSALGRFLARCPALQSHPTLAAVAQQGEAMKADDVVAVLADPFIHPSYTIPTIGCFRPLSRRIVCRAVENLKLVTDRQSDSSVFSEDIGDDDLDVIGFYLRRGRGLRIHELASLALCRALDLQPFLLKYILSYFRFSPTLTLPTPAFQRVLQVGSILEITQQELNYLLCAIRVTYRFLLMEPKAFSELWNWSSFVELLEQCTRNLDMGDTMLDSSDMLDVKWCGIQILAIVLKISDRATTSFGLSMDEAFSCLLRWEKFCQDTSIEKASWYIQVDELENSSLDGDVNFGCFLESFEDKDICSADSCLYSYGTAPKRRNCRNDMPRSSEFVLTPTLRKSFEMVMMAVSQKWPVLLHGPVGAGKTALINYLSYFTGGQDPALFIHVDEQMDSKTLTGTYICTEQPGEFIWQPGSLTQAISRGLWVVFEDIDRAPSEVHSIILPLLEGSSTFATGHGEVVSVAERFRLFGTISTSNHESSDGLEGRIFHSALWRKVMVHTSTREDQLHIVNMFYENLQNILSKLIDTFERVNLLASNQLEGIQFCGVASSVFSRFSLRDLLKWCKRISDFGANLFGRELATVAFQQAVDIFAASFSSFDSRLLILREVAKVWDLAPPVKEDLCPSNKPIIQNQQSNLKIGRVTLLHKRIDTSPSKRPFVGIRSSLFVLERIAASVKYNEPVLLVGETGTGKTTLVQNLAMRLQHKLLVMNLSQQSDVTDLLGGYKPTDARSICMPLYIEFKELFCRTFSSKDNEALLHRYETYAMEKNWKKLLHAFQKSVAFVEKQKSKAGEWSSGSKRKRSLSEEILIDWKNFRDKLDPALKQISSVAGMSFKFVEGAFVAALRNGHWILLDEVNLAPPEVLHRIIGVLEGEKGTLCLSERGDIDYVGRHQNFRLFACMNPANDAGKRDLPYSFRCRFSEYFVDDIMDDEDLTLFVNQYMDGINASKDMSGRIVLFYKAAKKASAERLVDGATRTPQFSLRSLARALEYTRKAEKKFGFQRAVYDGFSMFFLTSLDAPSAKIMDDMILSYLLDKNTPRNVNFEDYLENPGHHDVSDTGALEGSYILTKSVKEHLKNLARAVYIRRYPVLLQGPTSGGKTSLVRYLASVNCREFVRINNHEHTDLQEYFGTYITDSHGRLKFQEGVLVKAVREGHWVVLDELNLAPSDVLEALNRLLDDNRELFVPELQETIPAHPDFMLFATQNPPILYGGRKMLSRAFRNRFVEIHVGEIPEGELTSILEDGCKIPRSYAEKMVEVMKDLQFHRQSSKVFSGKDGFITPRDLFRWANRFQKFGRFRDDFAKDGYLLLAERLREENEKRVVQETLERRFGVKLQIDDSHKEGVEHHDADFEFSRHPSLKNITWTKSMQRLYFLVKRCYKMREPVLLVGDTGGGKTSVCQLLSADLNRELHILNCHQYTETSDFLGGFRPLRDRSKFAMEFKDQIETLKLSKIIRLYADIVLSSDISQASVTINQLNQIENNYKKEIAFHPEVSQEDLSIFDQVKQILMKLHEKWQTIFVWQDGPLVQAMKDGNLFLADEISLADDSVLERLNSVLEPERNLSLAEKGSSFLEKITAHPKFFILATMNPGGDYGKKELSPALRNRFTEIWVPPVSAIDELRSIAVARLKPELVNYANYILNFWEWFNQLETGRTLTVRDLLTWISFINGAHGRLGTPSAVIHGAFLVLLDGLTLGTGIPEGDAKNLREQSFAFLLEELKGVADGAGSGFCLSELGNYGWGNSVNCAVTSCSADAYEEQFGIHPFYISKGPEDCKQEGFQFLAPTTHKNALRVLRAMQLPKPVLLEGSPGVGKTSLVAALAEYSGHTVVRINLSEQTDMMDLLGSDLPFEGGNDIEFCWSDGILLQAIKNGSWVLLDELNLAPQSVLEGLNSILDHRADIFIPELGQTFKCSHSFRVFACQNPSSQGGGRKGLPKSFLNRFTKVYVDELASEDYLSICKSCHPKIPSELLSKLITFNRKLYEDTMIFSKYGQEGSPWEFNLRDVLRSCQFLEGATEIAKVDSFLSTVYLQRMRTAVDRKEVLKLFEAVFGVKPFISQSPELLINPQYLTIGSASVGRNYFQPTKTLNMELSILPGFSHSLEAALHCVQEGWLCILVGPHSSGKTSLVRLLAQLTGNALNELSLSSGTDTSELLGCFEQYNFFRHWKNIVTQFEQYINEYFSLRLELSWMDLISERKSLFTKWLSFLATINLNSSNAASLSEESWRIKACNTMVEIIIQLEHDLEELHIPVSWSNKDLSKTLKAVQDMQRSAVQSSAKFEWVTSDLIKAIECGEWVILDNANLCNPTVLDRINSLVEPEGSITINECGLVDGKPMVLHAHPKFRMFITVDPKHGEVSRAMRNRGVEVYMMHESWLPPSEGYHVCQDGDLFLTVDTKRDEASRVMVDGADITEMQKKELFSIDGCNICDNTDVKDEKRFLVLSGIPGSKLVKAMSNAHLYAKAAGSRLGIRITLLELARWVQLFKLLIMKGNHPTWSLQLSFEHTYLSSLGEVKGSDTIKEGKLYLTDSELLDLHLESSLSMPGGWPAPQSVREFAYYPREACVRRNCLYLEFLSSQIASYEVAQRTMETCMSNTLTTVLPSLVPRNMLHNLLLPYTLERQNLRPSGLAKFNSALASQMLYIAANWTIEQVNESDLILYIQWFKWHGSQLQPYCSFFDNLLSILKQIIDHPIWRGILDCRKKIVGLDGFLKYHESLDHVTNCLHLLYLTYMQWDTENNYEWNAENNFICPFFNSLRYLEGEVLNAIGESQEISQTYSYLLEHHVFLWKSICSGCFGEQMKSSISDSAVFQQKINKFLIVEQRSDYYSTSLSITWARLKKAAVKLRSNFSVSVCGLLEQHLKLKVWNLHEKPVLWVCGGRPSLPSSIEIYQKVQHILELCDEVWPKTLLLNKTNNYKVEDIVLSARNGLRKLALEGLSLSSYIITKGNEEDDNVLRLLEDIYKKLSLRFEFEREKLATNFWSQIVPIAPSPGCSTPTCCVFSPDVLFCEAVIDCWIETRQLFDIKSFSMDIKLLKELSRSTSVNSIEAYQVISDSSRLLRHALDYSLEASSRSPVDFSPHQKILWILDGWDSVDSAHEKLVSFVLEMWYMWHSSLWKFCTRSFKSSQSTGGCDHLMRLSRISTLNKILPQSFPIKDYDVHCLKVRAVSRILWEDTPACLIGDLRSAVCFLFRQIIFVHSKFFEENAFNEVMSTISQLIEKGINTEQLEKFRDHISSSSHYVLSSFSELISNIVEALPKGKDLKCPSYVSVFNLGCVWLYIGMLRFHLLLNLEDPDPAMKYILKQSHIQEKISSLQLEIKVRQDCVHITGRSSVTGYEKQRGSLLQKLEMEKEKIRRKVVFRPEPSKYKNLVSVCADFRKSMSFCMGLVNSLKCNQDAQKLIDEACNWQATSASFINRLSEEYAEYIDIIQPVQVAIYEMKLGLSIALSSALERKSLEKVETDKVEKIPSTIYSLMQFPRSLVVRPTPRELTGAIPRLVASAISTSESIHALDVNFVKELLTMSNDFHRDDAISLAIHRINLIDVAHSVCNSQFIEQESFQLLDDTFNHCARLWFDMKIKDDEEHKDNYYKFRPRTITIEDIFEQDFCLVHKSDSKGILASSCEEDLEEEEFIAVNQNCQQNGNLVGGWNDLPESILRSIVLVHNQLFEKSTFVECVGDPHISYEIRTSSFMDAYKLGAGVMSGGQLFWLRFSSLDDMLVLEHLLHMCLEYEKVLAFPHKRALPCNIYKDSNADMVKMVKPLIAIQERVNSLLADWDDHPGLQKILDLIHMLLALPSSTPLSKALLGLQVLVSKVQILQNSISRFSFSDQLHPLYELVSSWQRWGVDCWPALLERVQEQHDTSAESLWFPMYAVLHRTGEAEASSMSTVLSVEKFIESSSLGEFEKRLHLLLSFYGHLYQGACLRDYPSSMWENLKVLYNIFGYYVRFMPLVLEHIAAGKRCIEKELKECQKLFHWSQRHNDLSIENFRRSRQKIWKLVQRYNDMLQQPVVFILFGESRRDKLPSWLEKRISDNIDMEVFAELVQLNSAERFSWYRDWKNRAMSTLECMFSSSTVGVDILHNEEFSATARHYLPSASSDKNIRAVWQNGWDSLEEICRNTVEFAQLWNSGSKNLEKRRLLGTLLKNLERCGLSRHRSELDLQADLRSSFFLQPSYDVRHLHCKDGLSSKDVRNSAYSSDLKWETANDYYFKSLAILQQLRGFNFNKDLSLEQVNRATSFLFHLITIQQDQRYLVYKASNELKKLRQMVFSIGVGSDASVTPNQLVVLDRMWYQKQLFDSLLATSKDVCLIHERIKTSHIGCCDQVNVDGGMIPILFKFTPIFEKSKGSLNKYLFGCDGAINMSVSCMPFVATKQMEQSLIQNLQVISDFELEIQSLYSQNYSLSSAKGVFLNRFEELISWYKEKDDLIIKEKGTIDCVSKLENGDQSIPEEDYFFMKSKELMEDISDKLLKCHYYGGDLSTGNITMWKVVFKAYTEGLHLDAVCDALRNIIVAAVKLLAHFPNRMTEVEVCLKQLHVFLNLLLTFGESILSECLDVNETVAAMTNVLGLIFASVFTKGFGGAEDTADDSPCTKPQEASGTGMGEGEGVNDVSEQIVDEAQLDGTSEKRKDSSDKVPSKEDKGIEMDDISDADMFSVSEDSEDDNSKSEENLGPESIMGPTADGEQVVDEKLWNKDEDSEPVSSTEKYESGSSVKERDPSHKEFRPKDDVSTGDDDNDFPGTPTEDDKHDVAAEDDEHCSDTNLDKNNACDDPTEIQFNEEENFEDVKMDEPQDSDILQEAEPDMTMSDEEKGDEENPSEHGDIDNKQVDETSENIEGNQESQKLNVAVGLSTEDLQMDKFEQNSAQEADLSQQLSEPGRGQSKTDNTICWYDNGTGGTGFSDLKNMTSGEFSEMDRSRPDSSRGSRSASDQPKAQTSRAEVASFQRPQADPYRSMGDAMEVCKEKVEISTKLEEYHSQIPDELQDDDASEYRYVTDVEKSTSQSLGAAVPNQTKNILEDIKLSTDDEHVHKKDNVERMDTGEGTPETFSLKACLDSILRHKIGEKVDITVNDDSLDDFPQTDWINRNPSDVVLFKNSYMKENLASPSTLENAKTLPSSLGIDRRPDGKLQAAVSEWRKHEIVTARLSHELAEQLRLVLEPTIASKLQGDYRTGKRINMKKVIPYIASQFRKDKIWLRRTRPNKRDYQVMIVIDDSRSMSESRCGHAAIEALVTVCQAMSQLEVGQLAVASFGEKGNIKLLHDFDQPLTREAGGKMISSLSFKQDNTIADEPMVDLLKYLSTMLDAAVQKARMPSGLNPLHQLILIIADGRFHEKENLKRYVRDVLNKNRLIALILLDSPGEDSIMNHMEVTFDGGKPLVKKYLDSFPFPYYIILNNIEALPRTLADLLRQWFELMQNMRE